MIKVNGEEVKFERFPNGETKLIEDSIIESIGLMFPRVVFKYESDEDLIKLMFVKNYLDSVSGRFTKDGATLIIYYMPYSRMDRSENNSAFTLKYVTNFINSLEFGKVIVIEPHSDVTPALLNNVEPKYINFDLLPRVMEEVGFDKEEDFIMFPDAGASKRYKDIEGVKHVLTGHKHRDFKTGKITDFELVGEFDGEGDKVIIVDDLSSYGGTFVHSAKALREEGFEEIYLLVAHAEWNIFRGELFNHVDKVFTTDSILDSEKNSEVRIIDCDRIIDYDRYNLKIYDIEDILLKSHKINIGNNITRH